MTALLILPFLLVSLASIVGHDTRASASTLQGGPGYTPYENAVLADNPISFWPLDDTSCCQATDLEGLNNGDIEGNVALDQPGPMPGNSSMYFDGGIVNLTQDCQAIGCSLEPQGSFTVEAWINTTTEPGGPYDSALIFDAHACGFFLALTGAGYPGGLDYGTGCGTASGVSGPTTLTDGGWHYLVLTKDSSTLNLYVDGVLVDTASDTEGTDYPTTQVSIGDDINCGCSNYTGYMADVALYSSALSANEIAAHFSAAGYGSTCSVPATDLLEDPGFELPSVGTGGPPPTPVTNGWFAVSSSSGTPATTTSLAHCGAASGSVTGGYWVQDLPGTFNPTKPFEFSFWFYPVALGNQVSLVANWDRGSGSLPVYTNLISMSLTDLTNGEFQTQSVIGGKSVTDSPRVSEDAWHQFDATSSGKGKKVSITIDGQPAGSATLSKVSAADAVTLLMGATGGPNSTGPTNVSYDDVFVGPQTATTTSVSASADPVLDSGQVTFSAIVDSQPPYSSSIPTGVVSFDENGSPVSGCTSVPLVYLGGANGDTATCSTSLTKVGQVQVTADYSGGTGFQGSVGSFTETVANVDTYSENIWSGYALAGFTDKNSNGHDTKSSGDHYIGLQAAITVPSLLDSGCVHPGNDPCEWASSWIGIGGLGYTDSSLIQAGDMEQINPDGSVMECAFTEELPAGPTCQFPVNGGDQLSVAIFELPESTCAGLQGSGQCWEITMQDGNDSYSGLQLYDSSMASAEVIHERINGEGFLANTTNAQFDSVCYAPSDSDLTLNWEPFTQAASGKVTQLLIRDAASGSYATPSLFDAADNAFQVADGTTPPSPPPFNPLSTPC